MTTGDNIIIQYSGLPFYGYEGYRMVSVLLHISRSWEYDLSTSITCERMQDESMTGYTEEYHQERLYHSQRDDARIYDAWLKEKEK
jgi:hypothetical protein